MNRKDLYDEIDAIIDNQVYDVHNDWPNGINDAIPIIERMVNDRVHDFITHLCDTKVIDCASVESVLSIWNENNF